MPNNNGSSIKPRVETLYHCRPTAFPMYRKIP